MVKKSSAKSKGGKSTAAAPKFELSKSMMNKLPPGERPTASADLWTKSAGLCALCSLPLDLTQKNSIVPDHTLAEAKGGATTVANLYLAHRTCNASRQHLDFEIARELTKFRSKAEHAAAASFDFVLDNFTAAPTRQLVQFTEKPGVAEISFGHHVVSAPLNVDPATGVKYFFTDVPVGFVFNDVEIQPRVIMPVHVRKLALDFLERPVHEPSNCRLVPEPGTKTARLLQFDGQHKTTAQILIGRTTVPMKVYVAPSKDMLQSLVIKIQQEIKKQPLTRSETLAKIGDVMQRLVDGYVEKGGKTRTEAGFIESQPISERKTVRAMYFDELERIIFFDDDNELSKAVRPGVAHAPTTDKIVINRILSPFVCRQLLAEDLDQSPGRDEERKNILFIVNAITENMLPAGWNAPGNDLAKLRAENFFYSGSIGWWMGEILEPALKYALVKMDGKPLLVDVLTESEKEKIQNLIDALCSWPMWSTKDSNHQKAMRSNTVKNMNDEFPEYSFKRLLKDAGVI